MQIDVLDSTCQILKVMHIIPLGEFFKETKVTDVKYILFPYTLDLVATSFFPEAWDSVFHQS